MKRNILVAAILLIVVASGTVAQDKPAASKPPASQVGGLRFLDKAEVTIVNLEVGVFDKAGPVTGLKREDFEVYQDNRVQSLTNFAFYAQENETAATPTPLPMRLPPIGPTPSAVVVPEEKPREPRFIAIYVDNENILPLNRNRVLSQVTDYFLNKGLLATEQVMVVSYQRSMKVQQIFTSDPEEVADALRRLKKYTGGRSEMVSSRKDVEDYINSNAERNPDSIYQAMERAESFAREQRNNLTFCVRTLQELVTMMSGLPGKKSIIYISDGLPMIPGLELFSEIQERYRTANYALQSRTYDATDLFRALITTAASAGVTFYAIDARGLDSESGINAENRQSRSSLGASIAQSNYQDSLLYVTTQTGGLAILNSNDATPGLERIRTDMSTYYLLGYRLMPMGEDRVHRIQVKVKGRKGLRLNYNQVFIEKSLPTQIGDRVVSGLAFDISDNPLAIELKSGEPAPADNDRWTLPVEITLPWERIALIPDGEDLVGYLMVYYAARDVDGKQSDLQRIEHTVRMTQKEYENAKKQRMKITASLLLEPGKYRISVGVRDQLTNQAGFSAARREVHPELVK